MQIGILGSGLMGGKLGTIFARAGHEVVFSYARSEQKLGQHRARRSTHLVGRGGTRKEDSEGSRCRGVQHRSERGAFRGLRSKAESQATKPGVLR
jgi:3-hydroxyacyl-CoA dehydrogenase